MRPANACRTASGRCTEFTIADNVMHRSRSSIALAAWAALAAAGCSDSVAGPNDQPDPGGPVVSAPTLDNVPPVPIPASPGADVSATSAIHTTIARLDGAFDFNPVVLRAFGSWRVGERILNGPWTYRALGDKWSDELGGSKTASGLPAGTPPKPLNERMLLIDEGSPVQAPRLVYLDGAPAYMQQLVMDAAAFDVPVFVKRQRQWELDSFDGGTFHLIAPNQRVSLGELRKEGSSQTEITTFGTTITSGGGLDIQGLSVNIEKTLTRTFSTSVTVTVERTRQVTIDVSGEPGMLIDLRVWRLIDTYTLTDAQGNPLTHPAFVFNHTDGSMTWRTVAGTYPVQAKFRQ